ncbi:unnamed protein product [Parnassius apollo]|uniref:(apollo) hypothetical protein n=1 Tax=Parnassius apollo TaxID=110799 RepID=A0A8S3WY27_PARAO|nr:unnamed protein product [Parnassius apollo]
MKEIERDSDPPEDAGKSESSPDFFIDSSSTDTFHQTDAVKPMKRKAYNISSLNLEPMKKVSSLPSAAIQNIFVHPLSEEKKRYNSNDSAPFIVHIIKPSMEPSSATTIRSIKVGQFLNQNNIQGILKNDVKSIGRNRISIEFSSHHLANDFVVSPLLAKANFVAVILIHAIKRMGIIRGIPVDVGMDEFVSSFFYGNNLHSSSKL